MVTEKLRIVVWVSILLLFTLSGCKEKKEHPASHTINKNGSFHAPGLFDPTVNCVACHGATLEGGSDAPSCYSCHGKKW